MKKTYEQEQYPSGIDEHQIPDHPSTFMKRLRGGHKLYQLQMLRDVKFYLQESLRMEA
jgi:hypothetical protein